MATKQENDEVEANAEAEKNAVAEAKAAAKAKKAAEAPAPVKLSAAEFERRTKLDVSHLDYVNPSLDHHK